MHTPLHGIARQGVPSTSNRISYDLMEITLDLPVIVHNNPSPPGGGGMGALNKVFIQGGSVCSISIVPGRKLNKTQLKLEFCFPNSDHVMFSREFVFCLFINYAYMCRWIYVHRTTFERNNSLGYREQAYKPKGLLLHNLPYYCIIYAIIIHTRHKSQGKVFFASFGVQTLLITYK